MNKFLFFLAFAGALPALLGNPEKNVPETASPARPPFEKKHGKGVKPLPHEMSKEEAQMLKTLFLMPDRELARLRHLIDNLEKMPFEKRIKMAERLEQTMNASPEERKKMMVENRERFRKMQQNLLERYYATLPAEKVDAEREKFLKLSREEKHHYLQEIREKLGIPPPPPARTKPATPAH